MDDSDSEDDESDSYSRGGRSNNNNANDDERSGTKYNYAWFHVIFILAAMYVAMLLTDWYALSFLLLSLSLSLFHPFFTQITQLMFGTPSPHSGIS